MADQSLSLDLVMGVEEKTFHRVKKFGYGDGYEQIAPDGINSRIREYNITTEPLTSSDADGNANTDGLRQKLDKVCAGDFFVATLSPYSDVSTRYRVVDNAYEVQYLPSSTKYIFSFTLREAFAGTLA